MSTTYSPARAASAGGTRPSASLRLAATEAELEGHFAVRRAVFVERQGLFEHDDRDEFDEIALHAVAVVDGAVIGAVRLYPLEGTLWKGDRLAVLPGYRAGAELVNFAVRTAGERGGTRMIAQVQVPNVRFFERLGWERDGEPAPYHGVMHQPMAIDL